MRGIILKLHANTMPEVYEKITDTLYKQWNDKGLMILPKYVDLLAVIDDDGDVSICMAADEVIKNEKQTKIE